VSVAKYLGPFGRLFVFLRVPLKGEFGFLRVRPFVVARHAVDRRRGFDSANRNCVLRRGDACRGDRESDEKRKRKEPY
jgi:hypothetical protein